MSKVVKYVDKFDRYNISFGNFVEIDDSMIYGCIAAVDMYGDVRSVWSVGLMRGEDEVVALDSLDHWLEVYRYNVNLVVCDVCPVRKVVTFSRAVVKDSRFGTFHMYDDGVIISLVDWVKRVSSYGREEVSS